MEMEYEVIADVSGMSHEEWLNLRSTGIGGSDTGAIYGESYYTSPYSLWAQKSGREQRSTETNEAMEWGNILEDIVAAKFAKEYEYAVVKWPVMLRSKSNPFMLANLDFLIVTPSEQFPAGKVTLWPELTEPEGANAILEIKTTGIVGKGSAQLWEDDHVPRAYELQGLHYATVLGFEQVVFAALVAGQGLVVRGRVYGENEMKDCVEKETKFWNHVKSGIAPDLDGSDSTATTLTKMYPEPVEGKTVEADDFIYETFQSFVEAKKQADVAEKRLKELKAHLQNAIGEAEALTRDGQVIITYKRTKDSRVFDADALKEADPEVYERYTKVRPGYRVMRIK